VSRPAIPTTSLSRPQSIVATLLIVGTCGLIIHAALTFTRAQDWLPFKAAPALARNGEWRSLYPARGATSLFDVSSDYKDAARAVFSPGEIAAFDEATLTAFISPPPAAFLLPWNPGTDFRLSMRLWRLAVTLPMVLAIVWIAWEQAQIGTDAMLQWGIVTAFFSPVLTYVAGSGQPSGWLIAAAMVSFAQANTTRSIVGAFTLSLGIVTKATPLGVVFGLFFARRFQMALIAFSLSFLAVALTWPFAGLPAWSEFLDSSVRLLSTVVTDWNNASIDAAMVRTGFVRWPALVIRAALILLAAWTIVRAQQNSRKIAAVWIGWLASTPLLWVHYLPVLMTALTRTSPRVALLSYAACASLTLPFVASLLGLTSGIVGTVLALSWLATSAWLLSESAWMAGAPCRDEHRNRLRS
jgi:hypothetical protein